MDFLVKMFKKKITLSRNENSLSIGCEKSKTQSRARRLFLKFLLLTPPVFLLRIKTTGPFQNLNIDLLLNEAYGHRYCSFVCGKTNGHDHRITTDGWGCSNCCIGRCDTGCAGHHCVDR